MVHDGTHALQAAREFRPDIVFLDIGLRAWTATARRLRDMKLPMRIVAVTGWGQDADRERSQEAGFDLHLVKPVDPTLLTGVLSNSHSSSGPTLH